MVKAAIFFTAAEKESCIYKRDKLKQEICTFRFDTHRHEIMLFSTFCTCSSFVMLTFNITESNRVLQASLNGIFNKANGNSWRKSFMANMPFSSTFLFAFSICYNVIISQVFCLGNGGSYWPCAVVLGSIRSLLYFRFHFLL